jgi:hypothetical protein
LEPFRTFGRKRKWKLKNRKRWASNKCLAMKIYVMDEKLSINMFMDEMSSQQ